MDSFLEGKTLQDLIQRKKEFDFFRKYSIKKIVYQKIHSDFLNKYCNRENLTKNTQNDFNNNGVPKPTSSWTRINNDNDGHCFYHSIWRFMVMTEHPKLTEFLEGKGESEKQEVLEDPGWNKKGVALLKYNLLHKDRQEKSFSLKQSLKFGYYNALSEISTEHYAGDHGEINEEYQLMANFLNIGIAILTPKDKKNNFQSYWTFFCPGEETMGFCNTDFRKLENIAFIINSNRNHYETLIPTPNNQDVIDIFIEDRDHIKRHDEGGGGQRKKNRKFSKNKRKSKQTKRKITNKNRI